jgi:diketogulonate reductase-like aldo/keto reductase
LPYAYVDTDKTISKIGRGTSQFGSTKLGYGWDHADREADGIVGHALGLGVTLFDTAENALRSQVLSDQVSYNPVHRAPEHDLPAFAEPYGRVVTAYGLNEASPSFSGYSTTAVRSPTGGP